MPKKSEIEKFCDAADMLANYLRERGENHNCYKSYSSIDRIVGIRDSKKLYLTTGYKWNDIVDRNTFNDEDCELINFGKSFSYSADENVAMWMLYGGIHKRSGMIDFTKKGMKSILGVKSISIGYFDSNDVYYETHQLEKNDFEIYVIDVIYYKDNGNTYYISRSDESCHKLSKEVFESLRGCKKAYAWKYENECRLIVSVKKDLIDTRCNAICIDISDMDMGKTFERVYHGPNYPLEDTKGTLPSKLDNTIDWQLCDGKCNKEQK